MMRFKCKDIGTNCYYFASAKTKEEVMDMAMAHAVEIHDGMLKDLTEEQTEEVYAKLGLQWIPPELREATGELELAQKNKLPRLIELKDLKGDLQLHSNWSDGSFTIEQMAEAARARGLKYIAVTDHSQGLGIARGLTPELVKEQWK